MRQPAELAHGSKISTEAWIQQRTGGTLAELDQLFQEFESSLLQQALYRSLISDPLSLFITARAGSDWESAEFAEITTARRGGAVTLSQDVVIRRYTDPTFGDVAFIAADYEFLGVGRATAYADTVTEGSAW